MSVYDVVIIGAGAASLGASFLLRTQPLKYLVLEASDRTGGRAHTFTHKDTSIDLGAGWFHHGRKNVMVPLARAQHKDVEAVGLETFSTQPQAFEFETACALIDVQMEKTALTEDDVPAADTFELNDLPTAAAAYWMCNIDMGTEPQKTSVISWMQFSGDGENLFSPQGYGSVIEDGFKHVPVTLNAPVNHVDYTSELLCLHTPQGVIKTKKCICTVSMGVLNSEQIKFTPELPPWKRRAFSDVQMGHLLKVYLELHDSHLIPEDTWIYEPHENDNFFFYHLRPAGAPWIVVYLGGDHAANVGQQPSKEVARLLQKPLIHRYGLSRETTFGNVFFTNWSANPLTLGAYSSHQPGEFPLNNNLHRPVENKLFFAGEAFAGEYCQTVDGAFTSGQHTAHEVLKSLEIKKP
jgi:monoamine oxidase